MEQSTQNHSKDSKPISSFLNSPKFLGGFLFKNMSDHHHHHHHDDILMNSPSPTSILDNTCTNQFCNKDLFKPSSMEIKKHPYEQKGIGLALEVEEEDEEEDFDSFSKTNNRKMVIFGANLKKVEVPEPHVDVEQSASDLNVIDMKSPSDYGIKTKNLQLIMQSENSSVKSHCLREIGLSLSEMELSEEYTCVIKHGNDPKIIHIFDDMIVETCLKQHYYEQKGNNGNSLPVDFLGICCNNCKVKLDDDDKDIYMYRGEKSFCSPECRFQEMIMEEDEEKEFQIF